MWFFGKKKTNIYSVTREEEEQKDICTDELPSFAPEILTDPPKSAPIPEKGQTEEQSAVVSEEPEASVAVQPEEESERPEEFDDTVEEELPDECGSDPRLLFELLAALPYCSRRYALFEGQVFLACPDEKGELYLFGEFGEHITVMPEACTAFARISALSGVFKGKMYTSSDLEYITREHAWPVCVLAHNKVQYDTALQDGYKPYKRSGDGKGMILAKPISLHRMKELLLKVELTTTEEGEVVSTRYTAEIDRADLDRLESAKQYEALIKQLIERLLSVKERFFTVQVLKCRKNLVVCFPLSGMGQAGDRFAGGVITDMAQIGDGTVLFKIGNDPDITLPLKPGCAEKGQYRISLN